MICLRWCRKRAIILVHLIKGLNYHTSLLFIASVHKYSSDKIFHIGGLDWGIRSIVCKIGRELFL